MGSPTVSNAKPVPMENTDKKSLKTLIKSLFHKKKEKNTKQAQIHIEQKKEIKPQRDAVAAILENFNKLDLKDKKTTERNEEDDEIENFSFKVIEEHRNERIHSHSSEDSGFSDKSEHFDKTENVARNDDFDERIHSRSSEDSEFSDKTEKSDKTVDNSDELAEELEKLGLESNKTENVVKSEELAEELGLDDDKIKKKKLQTVVVSRGPIKTKLCDYTSACPYPSRELDPFRQISQINKHTLTGGQVIVNHCNQVPQDNLTEIDIACETLQQKSQYLQSDRENYLEDVMALIHEDTAIPDQITLQYQNDVRKTNPIMADVKMAGFFDSETNSQDYLLADIEKKTIEQDEILQLLQENNYHVPQTNPIVDNTVFEKEMFHYIQKELNSLPNENYMAAAYTYPTPPRSENVPSPMSLSPGSFYPSNSEYTLSPERSPIYNSDYEKYQDIPHFEEEKDTVTDKKARERTASISSMTMKQFKDLQKEIVLNFSKRECCQLSRKTCKELFQVHLQKLKNDVKKDLCMKVAKLDLKTAYGVLHHILLSVSQGSDQEDLQFVLFSLICERLLAEDIALFTGDAGLSLLKAAALRCPHKPLLTRYLVQCIRTAIKNNASLAAGKDYVFHEVDALGDTLVIACARAGDRCSDVLSEIVTSHPNQPPLFKLHHNNSDGYTALHVASAQHSAAASRLHTVHVLLEHAGFELTEGDLKGRDTALHLAVNAANCDLHLVLLMFKQVDRKEWKNLAHWPNLSTKTPIDLARLATKSTSRQNYPPEVLDFLKKCR